MLDQTGAAPRSCASSSSVSTNTAAPGSSRPRSPTTTVRPPPGPARPVAATARSGARRPGTCSSRRRGRAARAPRSQAPASAGFRGSGRGARPRRRRARWPPPPSGPRSRSRRARILPPSRRSRRRRARRARPQRPRARGAAGAAPGVVEDDAAAAARADSHGRLNAEEPGHHQRVPAPNADAERAVARVDAGGDARRDAVDRRAVIDRDPSGADVGLGGAGPHERRDRDRHDCARGHRGSLESARVGALTRLSLRRIMRRPRVRPTSHH